MGDEFSDWEGVYYDFPVCELEDPTDSNSVCKSDHQINSCDSEPDCLTSQLQMNRMTISNSRLDSSVDQYALEDSSFTAYVNWGKNDRDAAATADKTDLCVVTLYRITADDEVTLSDGTQRKIDVGIDLQGAIWDNMGTINKFSMELQSAVSNIQATTLTLLSISALLEAAF